VVLGLVLVVITVTSFGLNIRPATAESPSVLWSASFESGDPVSEFDSGGVNTAGGAIAAISSSVRYDGTYSGYYYYVGPAGGGQSRRAYPSYYMTAPNAPKFLVEMWVYVPSEIDGQPVTLTDWVSFASLWIDEGSWRGDIEPLTIDSENQQLNLWVGMLPAQPRNVYQKEPVKWPFDRWFKIGIQGDLRPGADSTITVFQDDVAIITYVGNLGGIYCGLDEVHFGLYMGANQGTFAVYNDAITVRAGTLLQVHRRS
jgi:hypothetical protein